MFVATSKGRLATRIGPGTDTIESICNDIVMLSAHTTELNHERTTNSERACRVKSCMCQVWSHVARCGAHAVWQHAMRQRPNATETTRD
eukprot:3946338-Alexandrium_andersonii.AAC.1